KRIASCCPWWTASASRWRSTLVKWCSPRRCIRAKWSKCCASRRSEGPGHLGSSGFPLGMRRHGEWLLRGLLVLAATGLTACLLDRDAAPDAPPVVDGGYVAV